MGQMGLGGLAPLLCELNLLDCACGAGWVNEEYKSRLVYRAGLSIEQNSLLRRKTQAQKEVTLYPTLSARHWQAGQAGAELAMTLSLC